MKRPTQMTIDELNQDEQQHLLDLASELHTRNNLIAASVMAKGFELDPGSATPAELNNFIQFTTNFLPSESMKKIGLLLIPAKEKIKLTAKDFAGVFNIIIEQKIEHDSKIVKLSQQLDKLQNELESRAQRAIKLQERESEIKSKKPFSFKLRFLVGFRTILNRISRNRFNTLALKVEGAITKLLPTIQISEVNNEEPCLESDADPAINDSEVEVAVAVPKQHPLNVLKSLKMPDNKVALDDNANDLNVDESQVEGSHEEEALYVSEGVDQSEHSNNKQKDMLEEWEEAAVVVLPKAQRKGIKDQFKFFGNSKKATAKGNEIPVLTA